MKENIETKDVQRTEYLDKNGLDMLWAKVKENTYNQVEEECDRAQAVEGDITNKLDNLKYVPYVSKTNMNSSELGDFVKYQLGATEFIISAQHGSNDARTEFRFGEVGFISRSKDSAVDIDYKRITVGLYNNIQFTNTGIRKYINRTTPAGSATEAFSTNGGVIDTTAFALKSELNSYAKKTDIPAIDTSDFVSKTTTDAQIINSALGIVGGIIQIVDSIADENPVNAELGSDHLEFDGSDRSTIELNGYDVNSNKRSRITIEAFNENPQILLNNPSNSDTTFQNYLKITNEGISSLDNNANHVYATDGSIADLTQYAKKSEITAGGNVDDVQVNDVSVVENKIANIKPATKESLGVVKVGDGLNVTDGTISVDTTAIGAGNYIPYREEYMNWYNLPYDARLEFRESEFAANTAIVRPGAIETSSYDTTNTVISIGGNRERYIKGIKLYTDGNDRVFLDDHSLTIFDGTGSNVYDVVKLNADGIKLHNGDNNHVLTSNASTIDITQYVLKSVYDEKIAALEARIAALEAKHTETA